MTNLKQESVRKKLAGGLYILCPPRLCLSKIRLSRHYTAIFKGLCKVYFVGRLSLRMLLLKKFCDLSKNFLCNFDPYAYHCVLIAYLLQSP